MILPYLEQDHKLRPVRTDTSRLGSGLSLEFGRERDDRGASPIEGTVG